MPHLTVYLIRTGPPHVPVLHLVAGSSFVLHQS